MVRFMKQAYKGSSSQKQVEVADLPAITPEATEPRLVRALLEG